MVIIINTLKCITVRMSWFQQSEYYTIRCFFIYAAHADPSRLNRIANLYLADNCFAMPKNCRHRDVINKQFRYFFPREQSDTSLQITILRFPI